MRRGTLETAGSNFVKTIMKWYNRGVSAFVKLAQFERKNKNMPRLNPPTGRGIIIVFDINEMFIFLVENLIK